MRFFATLYLQYFKLDLIEPIEKSIECPSRASISEGVDEKVVGSISCNMTGLDEVCTPGEDGSNHSDVAYSFRRTQLRRYTAPR